MRRQLVVPFARRKRVGAQRPSRGLEVVSRPRELACLQRRGLAALAAAPARTVPGRSPSASWTIATSTRCGAMTLGVRRPSMTRRPARADGRLTAASGPSR